MLKNGIFKSGVAPVLITIFLFSGCACNKTWREGFIEGALTGAALGGAGGYISSHDPNDDQRYTCLLYTSDAADE